MNNIVVNYKISKNIDATAFKRIIDGCSSEKYKVFLNIYDFSLSKNAKEVINTKAENKNLKIKIIDKDYEEVQNADNIILSGLIQHGNSLAFAILSENITLKDLDRLDLEVLKNDINGFLYFDYSVDNTRCYLRSRSMNVNIGIPVIFWSTQKLIRYLPEKEKLSIVANKYAGIHIPENLCTVHTDEK